MFFVVEFYLLYIAFMVNVKALHVVFLALFADFDQLYVKYQVGIRRYT